MSLNDLQPQHKLRLKVLNRPGVLVRTAQVFTRRGFNIDALEVHPDDDPQFSTMIVTSRGDSKTLFQIKAQLMKVIDIVEVEDFSSI